jgi:hypothetical protein
MNYQRIYNQIIERAKTRQLDCYKEKHHIIPKCMGGSNDKSNLVELTAREHFLCHRILCKIHLDSLSLKSALWFLINASRTYQSRYIPSGRVYENIKKEYALSQSKNMKGKKQSQETRIKKSKALTGVKKSKTHSENISKAKKGIGNHMYGVIGKNNSRSKPVFQYDLEGNFIKEWENGRIAAQELRINYSGLNDNCRNKQKTAAGYIWKYKIINHEKINNNTSSSNWFKHIQPGLYTECVYTK